MPDVSFDNLLIIAVIAVFAPLLAGALPGLGIPAVVLEVVAGIVVGPTGFGWVEVDLPVQILALFGLAFLLFLAGPEIDLMTLRGRSLRIAVGGYAVTLVLGLGAGAALDAAGWVEQPLLVAIALSATSLGLVVPVLKDAGQATSAVGQAAIAGATVADFAAIRDPLVLLLELRRQSGREGRAAGRVRCDGGGHRGRRVARRTVDALG